MHNRVKLVSASAVFGVALLAAGGLQEFINRGQKSKLCLLVHIALVA